ncbi:MAG: hypothetical protein ACQGVK_02740 [Myxococcota bacterium]
MGKKSTVDPALLAVVGLKAGQGEPDTPERAVFWDVVRELLSTLYFECEDRRRDAVVERSLDSVESWLDAARGFPSLGAQQSQLEKIRLVRRAATSHGRYDFRGKKEARVGPDEVSLFREYETVRSELKPHLKQSKGGRKGPLRHWLKERLPKLNASQVVTVETAPPSEAAYLVLQHSHGVGLEAVRKKIGVGRRKVRLLQSAVDTLQKREG